MEKIASGTTKKVALKVLVIGATPQKNGFYVQTETSEYNETGRFVFDDDRNKQATSALVKVGVFGAKQDMESALNALIGVHLFAKSIKEPISLTFEAVYGNEGESFTNTNTGEVSTYRKTGWNTLNQSIELGTQASAELVAENSDRANKAQLNRMIASEIAKSYTQPARRTYTPAVAEPVAQPALEPERIG